MIIDAHAHFASKETVEIWMKRREISEERRAILRERMKDIPETEKAAHDWAKSLELAGCNKALLMLNSLPVLKKVLSLYPSKFPTCIFVNPMNSEMDHVLTFIQDAIDIGTKAIKFHVSGLNRFYPGEREYDPIWEYAEKKQIPTYFHFGLAHRASTRIANPLEIDSLLARYPKLQAVIAHFGAGYLRETLFLAYKHKLYVDSSGKNTWLRASGIPELTLSDVFVMAIEAFGEDRVLFGTDSGYNLPGIRPDVMEMHSNAIKKAIEELELDENVWVKIMGENAAKFLRIK